MKVFETIKLLLTGIANRLYNLIFFIYESFRYGLNLWWWKVRISCFFQYFLTGLYSLVITESAGTTYNADNFIYGETFCSTIEVMLSRVPGLLPGDVFVDLGCGRGLTVLYAYFLKKLKCKGYDLIPTFIRRANLIKQLSGANEVEFYLLDILEADISNAKVIYVAGTTFEDRFIKKLTNKLRQARADAVIITLSYPLSDRFFNLFREEELWFSWGKTHVYYHKKRISSCG